MWNYPFTCFLTISLHVTNSPINLPVFSITPCCFYLSLVSNALIFHTTPIQSPHSVPGAELIRGFGEVRVEATDYHTIISCPAPHLFYPVPIHIAPLCKRWEMTSPVLTTIIQKQQQHAGKRRPWGRHENNGNIVPHLNAQHAGAETTSQCVCVCQAFSFISWMDILCLFPHYVTNLYDLIISYMSEVGDTMEGCFCSGRTQMGKGTIKLPDTVFPHTNDAEVEFIYAGRQQVIV